jgi:fructose 1,6-bisphosphatase
MSREITPWSPFEGLSSLRRDMDRLWDRFLGEDLSLIHGGDKWILSLDVSETKDARVQGAFPVTGEVLSPFNIGHFVAGFMRGSHTGPLMPVKRFSTISFFDGPPIVTCTGFCIHEGILTEPVDCFDHPYWDQVRRTISEKATEIRSQGFVGAAMLPYSELEYGWIVDKLKKIENKFSVRT